MVRVLLLSITPHVFKSCVYQAKLEGVIIEEIYGNY